MTDDSLYNKKNQSITASDVIQWLQQHPEFLKKNPEAINYLHPPTSHQEDSTVVDFQKVLLEKLRTDHAEAMEIQTLLVENSRANLNNQTRIHAAILDLLDANSFEEFIHNITSDLSLTLDVDVVCLAIESQDNIIPNRMFSGVTLLEKGAVNDLMDNHKTILQSSIRGSELIFAEAAGLVHSQALIRLDVHPKAPTGILAFGSREPLFFEPDQGIELVSFLARVIERCIRAWLDLPSSK